MDFHWGLAEELHRLRLERRLTLKETAHRAEVSRNALCAWEAGRQIPKGKSLDRLLAALGVPDRTRARLLAEADVPYARLVLAQTPLGPPLNQGVLLRALRMRRGISQSALAQTMSVTQSAVAKWESGDSALTAETLHAAGFALGATPEEIVVLTRSREDVPDGIPEEPGLVYIDSNLPIGLREAVSFALEAELWRRATFDSRWDVALCAALGWRANVYALDRRYTEILPLVERTLRLATTPSAREAAVPAINALTEAQIHRGESPEVSAQLCADWAAPLPKGQLKSWMKGNQALYTARVGRTRQGIELMHQAKDLDEDLIAAECGELHARSSRAHSVASAALAGGLAEEAFRALEPFYEADCDLLLRTQTEHANGRAVAEGEMEALRNWIYRDRTLSQKNLAELEAVERKQIDLLEKP